MLNKYFTKLLIWGANLKDGNSIFRTLKEISLINNSELPVNREVLQQYLLRWGFDKDIMNAPLMGKDDIRKFSEKVKPEDVYKTSYTGGSTGEPLKTFLSKKRATVRTASLLYYNQTAGYEIGDSFLLTRSKDESKLIKLCKNETIFVPRDLSETKLELVMKTILSKQIKVLIGYPSVLFEMAAYIKQNPEKFRFLKVKAIITSAEPVDTDRLNYIREAFNCSILDRYANEENGILAHQKEFGGVYCVDRYNFYIEVLNPETLQPVNEGETGKVVVTDFMSDLFPVIRYDTGDFAEVAEIRNGQVYSIKKIVGRIVDQFTTTDGTIFSPLTLGPFIRLPLTDLGIIFQFQFAQLSEKKYLLRLKLRDQKVPQANQDAIIKGLKNVLGSDASIDIEFVPELKARPSGKRPLYVNEWKNYS